MKLEEARYDNSETGCCARFDPAPWDEKKIIWERKRFARDSIRSILHIPINFGAVMTRLHRAVEDAGAYPEEPLWISDEVSPWRSDVYFAVDRDVPGAEMAVISGAFLAKVFEGPFRDVKKWMRAMEAFVASRGEKAEKYYFYYTTCPNCAKHYGENPVVILAKVA